MLALLGQEAMRRLRDAHTQNGLSPRQFELLGILHERGPVGQGELGALTGIVASALVSYLNPLEEAQLITRRRDPHDRRKHVVALTGRGRSRLQAASQAQRDAEDQLLSALTTKQRAQLRELLKRLRDSLIQGEKHCATPGSLDPAER